MTGYTAPSTGQAVRAVLFDTFGTVVDWRSGISSAVRAFAACRALTLDPEQFADALASALPAIPGTRAVWSAPLGIPRHPLPRKPGHRSAIARHRSRRLRARRADISGHRLALPPARRDSVEGIGQIKRAFIVGPLSNGITALLVDMAKADGLPRR